ncbi:MAG: ankyrin repeat domain-containing protein [Gammaproteobacteria bacterium]|nr:ankyrin repeat domain-containing protein [Gammaproteobacteria bacterium]
MTLLPVVALLMALTVGLTACSGGDDDSQTALDQRLFEAIAAGEAARVQRLLDDGAKPDAQSAAGSALFVAGALGQPDIAHLLLNAGATPTPEALIAAAARGDEALLRRLLDAGVEANAAAADGATTALREAIGGGHYEVTRILLEAGADPGHLSTDGRTAAQQITGEVTRALQMLLLIEQTGQGESEALAQAWRSWVAYLDNRGDPDSDLLLGNLYMRGRGVAADPGRALVAFGRAAAAGNREALFHLGYLYTVGDGVERDCGKALSIFEAIGGDDSGAQGNLAWILSTCPDAQFRDGSRALRIAENLVKEGARRDPGVLDTLAAAYAETGNFGQAVRIQEEAIALLRGQGLDDDVADFATRLQAYRSNQPWRRP